MAIAGILFDKDGTLLDYFKSWSPVNRKLALIAADGDADLAARLLKACGMDPETGHVVADSLLAAGNTEEIAEGLVAAGSKLSAEALVKDLDWLFAEAAANAVPVTDLAAFFARLKGRGLKLGIASSDSEAAIHALAAHFGFDSHLDFVAGYDSGHGVKPGGGMVAAFCRAVAVAPAETVVVGDNLHDMAMGRAAGAAAVVGVLTGTGTADSLAAAADVCLAGIGALETWLDAALVQSAVSASAGGP